MKILSQETSKILNTFSLKRGLEVFTSISVINEKMLFFDEHLNRLLTGADYLFPKENWPKFFDEIKKYFLLLNYKNCSHYYLRITIFDEYLYYDLIENPAQDAKVKLIDVSFPKTETIKPEFLKLADYALAELELRTARSLGFDDILYFDLQDNALESSTSNIYIITKENQIITPPTSSIVFDGIFRKNLLKHFSILVRPISKHELDEAREIWLSNAIQGLRFVMKYNKIEFKFQDSKYLEMINLCGRFGEKISHE